MILLAGALGCTACKSGAQGSTTTSPSATVSAPTKSWTEQARSVWAEAKIEDIANDAGLHLARVTLTYKEKPKPEDVATHVRALLAIEGSDRPCALALIAQDDHLNDAGERGVYFLGHLVVEPNVAYGTLTPKEIAKRMVERIEKEKDAVYRCSIPTWTLINTLGNFRHEWRIYVRDYSNVWDGSEKNALEAERICEKAADLDLFQGETFPDSSDAIETGVHFPQTSSQTIKWRSYVNYEDTKTWYTCVVNANEAPTITWDRRRDR
jgi:hypothetical protein